MKRLRNSQSGSAFFLILIAIAMFAMLSYAVFRGGQSTGSSLTSEQSRVAAQAIIAYGDAIAKAVQTLRLRGCTLAQISFEDPAGNSKQKGGAAFIHGNSNSPTDKSCHVFEQNGGKIISKRVSSGYIDPALVTNNTNMDSRSFIITMIRVEGAGNDNWDSSGTDLVLNVGRLTPQVCMKINDLLGVSNPDNEPPIDTFDSGITDYQGTMQGNGGDPLADEDATRGKHAMCVGADTSGETYTFYQVLAIQ